MTEGFKKLLKILLVFGLLIGGYFYADSQGYLKKMKKKGDSVALSNDVFSGKSGSQEPAGKLARPITVGFNTWCGWAGGPYANNGFKANTECAFYKDSGLQVQFVKNDNFQGGLAAFKSGAYDVWYCTADTFPVDSSGLVNDEPVIVMQTDWSRGGDAIVVANSIKTVADLKGKEIACAVGSPSHTLLLWTLAANQLTMADVDIVKTQDGIDSASTFKAGKVPAAVVWAPDDQDCVSAVTGAKVLLNTKQASKIIADCLYVKKSFLDAHPDDVKALVEGWLKANASLNSSEAARKKAAAILAAGFNVDESFCVTGINNARLCTYGDNQNFFGLNKNYAGLTGQKLYEGMTGTWQKLKLAEDNVPAWRAISDASVIRSITSLQRQSDLAEGEKQFAKLDEAEAKELPTISTSRVTVNFATGSAVLDEDARVAILQQFGQQIQGFSGARVRIEGNTDSVGSASVNQTLSKARAQSVAKFLTTKFKLDPDRFIVIGNGPNKPVADNSTEDGRAQNRRTDFELVQDAE